MKLLDIKLDTELQSRVEISDEAINDYSEALREGAKFPPVTVFYDGSSYFLADGWHRYYAHKKAGLALIEATVINGTFRDAKLFSFGANDTNGLRKTNADKRKAVLAMLDDMEWAERNDNEIAKECRVSIMTVGRIRKQLGVVPEEIKYVKNGKEFTMKRPEFKPLEKVESKLEYQFDEKEEKIHELATEIQSIAEENEVLKARVAVASMEATDEEKRMAQDQLMEKSSAIKNLEIDNRALRVSRDTFQNQVAELKNQVKYWQRRAEKSEKRVAELDNQLEGLKNLAGM